MNGSKILLCVNSDIGRGNTIGFRFGKIATELQSRGIEYDIIARANYAPNLVVRTPWFKNYLGRLLNALHIYIFPKRNVRAWEIKIFDAFVFRSLKKHGVSQFKAAHLGEFLPRSIAYLKLKNIPVFLDIPIAHPAYAYQLQASNLWPKGEDHSPEMVAAIDQSIRLADTLVVPSEFVVRSVKLANFKNKRTVVIPFGADTPAHFSVKDITERANQRPIKFLFAGNVNYRKGIQYLLKAWQECNFSDAELVICGRVYAEVADEIEKYHFKNVHYTGFVDVTPYMRAAHVFVFPTLLEGSAKAVYEAMSYGLAVITTPNAGSVIVNDETGKIVPVANATALAGAMRELKANPAEIERLGQAASRAVRSYTWSSYSKKVVDTYSSISRL